eukprot:TRINITY_DN3656_c0_g1_i2.p1 TRINITY_DN3656_c0_g1~~TRINITY_DN3656_c0_g1_i2.p1  ORF type:complete len:768 (+),score=279.00 TRINITY_DN3656_c0_g1_i2:208-2511(+)
MKENLWDDHEDSASNKSGKREMKNRKETEENAVDKKKKQEKEKKKVEEKGVGEETVREKEEPQIEIVGEGPYHHCKESGNFVLMRDPNATSKRRNFALTEKQYNYLLPYQREGVAWLWELHQKSENSGGILGDDMGLGKTLQIITFIIGLFRAKQVARVLLVMPVSTVENWKKEFAQWECEVRLKMFYGSSKAQRNKDLDLVLRKGGICITTYGMITSNAEQLVADPNWDYVILDEGHKIKNTATKLSKMLRTIQSKHRIILSGTPITNNLREMWALFDYTNQGTLLGDSITFKREFEDKIVRASDRDATMFDKKVGAAMSEEMRNIIKPYFLRREKKEVFKGKQVPDSIARSSSKKEGEEEEGCEADRKEEVQESLETSIERPIGGTKELLNVRKNDFVVWVKICKEQLETYKAFLETEEVQLALNKTNSPLAAIGVLKKLCQHPLLLNSESKMCQDLDLGNFTALDKNILRPTGIDSVISVSGKLIFLAKLLPQMKLEGHRVLLFSQSVKMLTIFETVLKKFGYKFLRIDGSTKGKDRQILIDQFNSDPSYFCFMLTTEVGGLGINLTGANRAVIFDPAWTNLDDQAVDRIYRIGQKKDVVVYRLITSGTIEEKIYRKQVFKGSLLRNVMQGKKHPYFRLQQLRELFVLDDPSFSETQRQLHKLHSARRVTDETLDKHIEFLHSLDICGISDHNLLYSEETESIEHDEMTNQAKEASNRLQTNVQEEGTKELKKKEVKPADNFDFDLVSFLFTSFDAFLAHFQIQ